MVNATKNAHDWHCEDHDTYGWRGQACKQCPEAPSETESLRRQRDELLAALLQVARMAESLKRECGMDPESPQAIRNGEYMNISYEARAAITKVKGGA